MRGRRSLKSNLSDYLDTGLFLDHRPVRRLVAELAAGQEPVKPILLYRAVSVQAALWLQRDAEYRYVEHLSGLGAAQL